MRLTLLDSMTVNPRRKHIDSIVPGLEAHYTSCRVPKPKIGIIIPCWNHFEYTKKTLDSYFASISRADDYIVLIFDNHSRDETQKFFEKAKSKMGNVCYFRYKENQGVTRPWNDGLRYCIKVLRVEYVFLVNNDVIFSKGCVERLVRWLERVDDAHLIGPLTNRPGVHRAQNIRNFLPRYKETDDLCSIEHTSKAIQHNQALAWDELNGFFFGGKTVLFRRNVFKKFPIEQYFDPRNFVLHNEREFQARLRQKGLKILLATNSFVFHYKGITRQLGPEATWTPHSRDKSKRPVDQVAGDTKITRAERGDLSLERSGCGEKDNGRAQPRIFIGICSCCPNSDKREAVRTTWLKGLPNRIRATFFAGRGRASGEDIISLPVADDYNSLPKKVQVFFQHALAHYEFEYLFKCDDDTYAVPERLFGIAKSGAEFIGSRDWWPSHADGGAGYLLSRRAVAAVASAACPDGGPEDVWVTKTLRAAGIELQPCSELKYECREFPGSRNRLVTAHHCSPVIMSAIHARLLRQRSSRTVMSFEAVHTAWQGPLVLLQSGIFLGGASRPHGQWKFGNDGKTLVIDWFNWPRDTLRKKGFGYANATLRLEKTS